MRIFFCDLLSKIFEDFIFCFISSKTIFSWSLEINLSFSLLWNISNLRWLSFVNLLLIILVYLRFISLIFFRVFLSNLVSLIWEIFCISFTNLSETLDPIFTILTLIFLLLQYSDIPRTFEIELTISYLSLE